MIKKTKDYDMFKLTNINRADGISHPRVQWLKQQIQRRNLLDMCPILVNKDMEIIQGQHRWQAAKELGVDLYYEIKELQATDILDLNSSKSWKLKDYMNFWARQGNQNYIKLESFAKETGLAFEQSYRLCSGHGSKTPQRTIFQRGEFVFREFKYKQRLGEIFDIIGKIKFLKTYAIYIESARFFNSLLKVMDHENYVHDRMLMNLEKLCDKIGPRATEKGYIELLCEIFNWRTTKRITFNGEE